MSCNVVAWPASLGKEDRQKVRDCAHWAQLAYSDEVSTTSGNEPFLQGSNLTNVRCEVGDAQCLIFDAPDGTLVVSVRGTTSPEDMLCDICVVQTVLEDLPDVKVHAGFNVQYKGLSKVVNSRIMRHLTQGGNLICTGHSLGAGVAALFAVAYGIRFLGSVSYFGFGSPRQGNETFGHLMQTSTSTALIVKNLRDPICACIPAVCLPSRYEHAGVPVYIGEDPFPDVPNILNLADHDIAKYVTNLEDRPVVTKQKRGCLIG